jgi:TetR/AcrR family transcriptional regulator
MMTPAKTRIRDPQRTRSSVLDAAEELFAERGFAGTSMRDLARASGVSQALIHHHFGSKEELYQSVKRRVVHRFQEIWSTQVHRNYDEKSLLAKVIQTLFWFLRENQAALRLGAWSRLEGSMALWPGEEEAMRSASGQFQDVQEKGVLREDIDPLFLTIMIEAVSIFWWEHREIFQGLFNELDDTDVLDELYLEQVLKVFVRGTCAVSSKGGNE